MIDPESLIALSAEMEKPTEIAMQWRQVVDRFDRGKRAKLAQLMKKHLGDGKKSMAQLEMEAYSDEEWSKYLEEWEAAEKNYLKAQVRYDTLKNRFDATQSALSYYREAIKRGVV